MSPNSVVATLKANQKTLKTINHHLSDTFSTGTGASQPKAHSLTPSNGPNTCRTIRNPTTVEEIEVLQSCVTDTESAEKFLTAKLLCQEGQPYSLAHLSTVLFHITQMSMVTPLLVNTASPFSDKFCIIRATRPP
ncbi:hypothetical protein EV424DRAFT_1540554 [Suillus variegatus]|nr:hypothetical protein EV424DRAFT_1540554 [Suillus variegatus]